MSGYAWKMCDNVEVSILRKIAESIDDKDAIEFLRNLSKETKAHVKFGIKGDKFSRQQIINDISTVIYNGEDAETLKKYKGILQIEQLYGWIRWENGKRRKN